MVKRGWLEVFVGPMASGKSRALVERLRFIAPSQVIVFKPMIDDRSPGCSIASRDLMSRPAVPVASSAGMAGHLTDRHKVVGIDEAQFFDAGLVEVVREFVDERNLFVAVAGLDTDFRGEPFEQVAKLMAVSDALQKLFAVCVCCGGKATRSQRLIDDAPAPYDAARILVGGNELYEARCRHCHAVPRPAWMEKIQLEPQG